jgi:hypothetical protein
MHAVELVRKGSEALGGKGGGGRHGAGRWTRWGQGERRAVGDRADDGWCLSAEKFARGLTDFQSAVCQRFQRGCNSWRSGERCRDDLVDDKAISVCVDHLCRVGLRRLSAGRHGFC